MKALSLVFLPVLISVSMLICERDAVAASKQGGGTFFVPKKKSKRTIRKVKTTTTPAVSINYDGNYSLNLTNTSQSTIGSTCLSGTRNIQIANGETSGEIFPFIGAVLGGTVRNGKVRIFKIRDGIADRANYSGLITLPKRRGETGTGQLKGENGNSACVWRATLTRR